jgi:selT/selW/selH-like putative selenoprotein
LEIELVESGGGAFEVFVDGERIHSKLASKRFPSYQEIPSWIEEKLLEG